jgi:tetratricopeptide (TPR) repeat protein
MDEVNARGFAAFDRGDFTGAAAIFMAAHEIYGDPNLLKNAAIAYYAAGRCDRARQNALAFLKAPDALAADRGEMTRLIGRCDALAEAELEKQKELERQKELEKQKELDKQKELELQAELERQKELEKLEPPPKKDEVASASKTLGGVLMGVGSATLVSTVIYHAYAFQESEELREISLMGGDARRYAELSSSVDTARVVVPTLYAVSGALIGGGAWLVFRPERDEETQQTRVSFHLGYTARF